MIKELKKELLWLLGGAVMFCTLSSIAALIAAALVDRGIGYTGDEGLATCSIGIMIAFIITVFVFGSFRLRKRAH